MNERTMLTCSTNGDELLRIARTLRAAANSGLIARERLPDGVQFRIRNAPPAVSALTEFVQRERTCCPFFTFDVVEDVSEVQLRMEGPAEAAPLLDLLYRLAEPPTKSVSEGS